MSRRNKLPDPMSLAQAASAIGYAETTTERLLRQQGLFHRDDNGRVVVSKGDLSFLVGTLEAKLQKNFKIKLK